MVPGTGRLQGTSVLQAWKGPQGTCQPLGPAQAMGEWDSRGELGAQQCSGQGAPFPHPKLSIIVVIMYHNTVNNIFPEKLGALGFLFPLLLG